MTTVTGRAFRGYFVRLGLEFLEVMSGDLRVYLVEKGDFGHYNDREILGLSDSTVFSKTGLARRLFAVWRHKNINV